MHHLKELTVRYLFGLAVGFCVAEYFYPSSKMPVVAKTEKPIDPDLAVRLIDDTSVQFSNQAK